MTSPHLFEVDVQEPPFKELAPTPESIAAIRTDLDHQIKKDCGKTQPAAPTVSEEDRVLVFALRVGSKPHYSDFLTANEAALLVAAHRQAVEQPLREEIERRGKALVSEAATRQELHRRLIESAKLLAQAERDLAARDVLIVELRDCVKMGVAVAKLWTEEVGGQDSKVAKVLTRLLDRTAADYAGKQVVEAKEWSKQIPTNQAWYWHWSGDPDCGALPTSVLYSGTTGKYFVSMGQLGLDHAIDCEEYGGYWIKMDEPSISDK
jgi:hypothetical protein